MNKAELKKILRTLLLMTVGSIAAAQEIPAAAIYYTGKTGQYFRKYPVPPGTRFSVRKIKPEELDRLAGSGKLRLAVTERPLKGTGLSSRKLGYRAAILAVHPANNLRNITSAQVRSIVEKNHGSWRTFGGPSARIHLYIKAEPELPPPVMHHHPEFDKSRPKTILDLPPLGDEHAKQPKAQQTVKYSVPLKIRTASDAKSFSMLCTDPLGLACFDITRYDENRVPILSVDKIPPTLENFRFGSYPLLKVYYLTVPNDPNPAEKKLIEYIRSRTFAAILYQDGILPEKL